MSQMTPQDLDLLFLGARTYHAWQDKEVDPSLFYRIYDVMKMGPTSSNCCPGRFVFLTTREAKERLLPALAQGNVKQTMEAPVTVIMAYDLSFHEKLDYLSPQNNARTWFEGEGKEDFIRATAELNATLEYAYFMMAARACGLDCGPMTGFKAQLVDEIFFQAVPWRAQVLCNLGHGDPSGLYPRSPRLSFDEACWIG